LSTQCDVNLFALFFFIFIAVQFTDKDEAAVKGNPTRELNEPATEQVQALAYILHSALYAPFSVHIVHITICIFRDVVIATKSMHQ